MRFFSLDFLIFLTALLLLFHLARARRVRRGVLTAANAIFVLSFAPAAVDLIGLLAFVAAGYLMVRAIARWHSPALLGAFIALLVGSLLYLKRYWFVEALVPDRGWVVAIEVIGVSYLTFKTIHLLVDQYQDALQPVTALGYANYQLGFVSLVAGPIQRFNDFRSFWERIGEPSDRGEYLAAWNRLANGLIKMGLLSTVALWVFERAEAAARLGNPVGLAGIFYGYPAYVYLNFSGYSDIVIAAAALLGLRQQENFNRPYVARNLVDFWNRWHISLTLWIRDYVFTTSYKALVRRWPRRARHIGYFCLFMALFLAGVWHGPGWNFVMFGAIHGLGVLAVQVYTNVLQRRLGRAGVERYVSHPGIRAAAVLVTLHYVCFSFLFFRSDLRQTASTLTDFIGALS